ncbi:hypothetical protein ASF28_18140 [Methylobacterium sp. Leaf99]|uniref:hypothetical protein n=1 Tax=Methylobacterium sp. Leaf99 TaxID=1736251 RepID=UPI0006FD836D|nr:hypothetical protein [Methylobacterium sp. Leaf99]KQP05823.1 hypothetical protein ASF28_18140 [Methylobacterium sp. Leaf99]
MSESTVRNLLSPARWRRLWDRLGEMEEALSVTGGEIRDGRIARLEAEIAALRVHAGPPPRGVPASVAAPPSWRS